MEDLVLAKMNLNVFGSNFGVYPTPPLSPKSFQIEGYFPETSERDARIIDRQHDALKLLMGGNHLRQIRNPKAVLDLGSGMGAWVVELGQEFATADEVVGVDIEATAPLRYPPNCRFEVADVDKGIRYPDNYFSFIHSRSMKTGIHEWPDYIAEIFRVAAPGGHIQFTELDMEFISHNDTLGNDAALTVLQKALQKYAFIQHLDLQVGSKLAEMARRAGFHSVEEKTVEVPCGVWQSDVQRNKIGTLMMEHFIEDIGIWGRSSMIQIGVPEDVADLYIEKALRELKDPRFQLSVRAWYVTARKAGRSRSSSPKGSPKRSGRSPPSSPK